MNIKLYKTCCTIRRGNVNREGGHDVCVCVCVCLCVCEILKKRCLREVEWHHPVGREIRNLCQQDGHHTSERVCVCVCVCVCA